jgi:hypothetical protein
MKKFLVLLSFTLALTSCAKWSNRVDADGGIFGSYNGDWVVITYSGNHITDVYKMSEVMVQSEAHSDGWLFVTNNNAIHVGGNTKAIRVNNKESANWDDYIEYHSELTDLTYQEYKKQMINNKNSIYPADTSGIPKLKQ